MGQHPAEWFEEAALKVSEHFDAFEALISEHAREENPDEDDPDVSVELLSIPIWLPGGYVWEIELDDNGDDAGTSYYLHGPGLERRLELGVLDAHSRLPILRWPELEQLLGAISRDERNRASGVVGVGLLLCWAAVGLTENDPVHEIRARLETEWRESGLVMREHAAILAAEAPTASAWKRHPELGWLMNERYRFPMSWPRIGALRRARGVRRLHVDEERDGPRHARRGRWGREGHRAENGDRRAIGQRLVRGPRSRGRPVLVRYVVGGARHPRRSR